MLQDVHNSNTCLFFKIIALHHAGICTISALGEFFSSRGEGVNSKAVITTS